MSVGGDHRYLTFGKPFKKKLYSIKGAVQAVQKFLVDNGSDAGEFTIDDVKNDIDESGEWELVDDEEENEEWRCTITEVGHAQRSAQEPHQTMPYTLPATKARKIIRRA